VSKFIIPKAIKYMLSSS